MEPFNAAERLSDGRDRTVAPDAAPPRLEGARDLAGLAIVYVLFWGTIASWLSSWFPVALGAFLFFTRDALVTRILHLAGIRLAPSSLVANAINAFVFTAGLTFLAIPWRASAPAWLMPWIPPHVSWFLIAGTALACAGLAAISAAAVRHALPRLGIKLPREGPAWAIANGLIGFGILGLVALLVSTPLVPSWLGAP